MPARLSVHHSSARSDWRTPAVVLDLVRQLGPIALDPCPHPESLVHATTSYSNRDGLTRTWITSGVVFVNPPYGRQIGDWMAKCRETDRLGYVSTQVVALVPARTDARWWQDHVTTADVICFWRGRLTFVGAPAPAPFPSAIAYWGAGLSRFQSIFAPHGWVVAP